MKKAISISIALFILFTVSGCDTPQEPAEVIVQTGTPQATQEAIETPQQTTAPSRTPVKTTQPELTSTPSPEGYVYLADGFGYYELTDELKQRITGMSYPEEGSDIIGYDDLRYIELLYYDFDGDVNEGELIVNKQVAQEVTQIFYELFLAEYPLESVKLVDDYGEPGDDNLSMAANNTSAFNYRYVTGSSKLSMHSYGAAIDINPVQNPYIDGERVVPEEGRQFLDRTLGLPGMIDHDDLCYKLFTENGWRWGGDWSGDKDYQHFSKDLGY